MMQSKLPHIEYFVFLYIQPQRPLAPPAPPAQINPGYLPPSSGGGGGDHVSQY